MTNNRFTLDIGYFNFMRVLMAYGMELYESADIIVFKIDESWGVKYNKTNHEKEGMPPSTGYIYYQDEFIGLIRPFGSIISTEFKVGLGDFCNACKECFRKVVEAQEIQPIQLIKKVNEGGRAC
jgi:hypothetical protein